MCAHLCWRCCKRSQARPFGMLRSGDAHSRCSHMPAPCQRGAQLKKKRGKQNTRESKSGEGWCGVEMHKGEAATTPQAVGFLSTIARLHTWPRASWHLKSKGKDNQSASRHKREAFFICFPGSKYSYQNWLIKELFHLGSLLSGYIIAK